MAPMIQAPAATPWQVPPDMQRLIDIIKNITGIAAGGMPSWIVTGVLFLIAIGFAIWGKAMYNKYVNQANEQRKNQDIATGKTENETVSDAATAAANQIDADAKLHPDADKLPIPPEP